MKLSFLKVRLLGQSDNRTRIRTLKNTSEPSDFKKHDLGYSPICKYYLFRINKISLSRIYVRKLERNKIYVISSRLECRADV